MLEEQDWEKIQKTVEKNKFVQKYRQSTEENKTAIKEREEKKSELHQQIRDYRNEIRLINGRIRSDQALITSQDRAILACQKRISLNDVKIDKIRGGVIDRAEEAVLKRKRIEFRKKIMKDKAAEIWDQR
jgi:predicted  nucleic acid-binding Zn-ribbon protein